MTSSPRKGVTPFIRLDADGQAYLEGQRCGDCGATHVGARLACSACASRTALRPVRLAREGRLNAYAIVHRSFPGVTTPFISAVVDLEGGGCLKGTLKGLAPDPEVILLGMPVQVVFEDLDAADGAYVAYGFHPSL